MQAQEPSLSMMRINPEPQLAAFVRLIARITTNVRGTVTQCNTGTIRPTVVCHVHLVVFRDVVMERTVMCVLATAIRRVAQATILMSASILLLILPMVLDPPVDDFSVTIRILL